MLVEQRWIRTKPMIYQKSIFTSRAYWSLSPRPLLLYVLCIFSYVKTWQSLPKKNVALLRYLPHVTNNTYISL